MSAVPTVTDALVSALAALFPEAAVRDGDPLEALVTDNEIVVGDSTSTEEPSGIDPTVMWEVIDLTVTIGCARGGDTAKPARDAAFDYLDGIRTYLRTTSRTIGGTALGNGGVVSHRHEQGIGRMGRWSIIEATVRIYAEVS